MGGRREEVREVIERMERREGKGYSTKQKLKGVF